jgi:hypothetical protein
VKNGIVWGDQVIPIFDDQLLPVFGAVAVSSDVLMEEMCVGNNPGVGGDGKCVVGNLPLNKNLSNDYFNLMRAVRGTT